MTEAKYRAIKKTKERLHHEMLMCNYHYRIKPQRKACGLYYTPDPADLVYIYAVTESNWMLR